jgi:hypothetical protein
MCSSPPWIGSTHRRPPRIGPAVVPLASVLASELGPTSMPLTGLLALELGFVSSESRRCGGWVDRLRSIEHSCPAVVWPISPFIGSEAWVMPRRQWTAASKG